MTTLLSFLASKLGEYKEHSKGETYFCCPFCHSTKKKFAINLQNLKWHCWHCNARGASLISLFKRLNLTRTELNKLRGLISESDIKNYRLYESDTVTKLLLPQEYISLYDFENSKPSIDIKHALHYLINIRKLTIEDICRYNIGFCPSGEYKGRIIIPSYNASNELNYFIGRSIYPNTKMKYKNPPISKNIAVFENQVDWTLPITLCEGAFDAIKIGFNAIPMLGKFIPAYVMSKIIENKPPEVYIFLDPDATEKAIELQQKLMNTGINSKLIEPMDKDAGDMNKQEIWGAINTSKCASFRDLIQTKLKEVT